MGPHVGVGVPSLAGSSCPGKSLATCPTRPEALKNETSRGEAGGRNPFLFIQGRLFLNKGYIVPFAYLRFIITLLL